MGTQNEEKKNFFLLYPNKLEGLQLTVCIITINYTYDIQEHSASLVILKPISFSKCDLFFIK